MTSMTREQMAGFLFGIGVGTFIGYFLQNDAHKKSPHALPARNSGRATLGAIGEATAGPVLLDPRHKENPRSSLAM